jgi:CDP-4-dehydro-6-deoxyglucose reductase, E1
VEKIYNQFASDRHAVLKAAEAYQNSKPKADFEPGKTYIPASGKMVDFEDLAHLLDASLDMWLTAGRYSDDFEAKLGKVFDRKTPALLVNSGSSANLLAISSLGSPLLREYDLEPISAGDEIITAAVGFPTTVAPIVQNGWTPVFVDVDLSTLNVTLDRIAEAVTPRTRGIMIAHTLGNPFRADLIADFCKDKKIFLVEDCCDALGASIETTTGTKSVGTFGQYATLSFYPAHHITMGEGGCVIPRNAGFRRIALNLRDWGRDCWCDPGKDNTCGKRFNWQLGELPKGFDHKYTYSTLGFNLKATDMQAALGVSQLKKLPFFLERRRQNYSALTEGIKSSPVLAQHLTPVVATEGTHPSWFGFPILCQPSVDRRKVQMSLEEQGVGTRLVFAGNMIRQPALQDVKYRKVGDLKNSDTVMAQAFWVGVHPSIDQERLAYMLEALEVAVKSALL